MDLKTIKDFYEIKRESRPYIFELIAFLYTRAVLGELEKGSKRRVRYWWPFKVVGKEIYIGTFYSGEDRTIGSYGPLKQEKGVYYICTNDPMFPFEYVNTKTPSLIECSLWKIIDTIIGPTYIFKLEKKAKSEDSDILCIYKKLIYNVGNLSLKIAFGALEDAISLEDEVLLSVINKLIKVLDLSALVLKSSNQIFVNKDLCNTLNCRGEVYEHAIKIENKDYFWKSLHSVISQAIREELSERHITQKVALEIHEGIKKFFEMVTPASRGCVFELIAYPLLKDYFGELEVTCPIWYSPRLDFRVKNSGKYIEVKYNSWFSPSQISFAIANASELYVFSNTRHIRASTFENPIKRIKLKGTVVKTFNTILGKAYLIKVDMKDLLDKFYLSFLKRFVDARVLELIGKEENVLLKDHSGILEELCINTGWSMEEIIEDLYYIAKGIQTRSKDYLKRAEKYLNRAKSDKNLKNKVIALWGAFTATLNVYSSKRRVPLFYQVPYRHKKDLVDPKTWGVFEFFRHLDLPERDVDKLLNLHRSVEALYRRALRNALDDEDRKKVTKCVRTIDMTISKIKNNESLISISKVLNSEF